MIDGAGPAPFRLRRMPGKVLKVTSSRTGVLGLTTVGNLVVRTGSSMLLTWWWRNAWAIIAAMVFQDVLRAFLSYTLFRDSAHRLARDPAISREFRTFSRMVLASSAMTLLIAQSDKFVLGRLFTLGEFG